MPALFYQVLAAQPLSSACQPPLPAPAEPWLPASLARPFCQLPCQPCCQAALQACLPACCKALLQGPVCLPAFAACLLASLVHVCRQPSCQPVAAASASLGACLVCQPPASSRLFLAQPTLPRFSCQPHSCQPSCATHWLPCCAPPWASQHHPKPILRKTHKAMPQPSAAPAPGNRTGLPFPCPMVPHSSVSWVLHPLCRGRLAAFFAPFIIVKLSCWGRCTHRRRCLSGCVALASIPQAPCPPCWLCWESTRPC
uniref:Uncharacterized protein n=1 Tax=Laticauda laticaudata TaxID=8630 RepID=A0A8C5SDS0_LATLA